MKEKILKISDEDFDGLLPADTHSTRHKQGDSVVTEQTVKQPKDMTGLPEVTTDCETPSDESKKLNKPRIAASKGISVRLTFSTQEFKSLTLLALNESEKIGKRVSVTSLLSMQVNKLIKKGVTTNA